LENFDYKVARQDGKVSPTTLTTAPIEHINFYLCGTLFHFNHLKSSEFSGSTSAAMAT